MSKEKWFGLFRLFRFELPFTAGVCVVLGELLALGKFPPFLEAILGFLSVFFISAAALILNDLFDLETDKTNAPERPLPSGLVTEREVVLLFGMISILGFGASLMIGFQVFLVALLVWIVGFLYNWRFKKTGLPGNLMVSFSVGMTFIFGGLAVGHPFERAVWSFAMLVFLINLGEEIAGDAMDIEGDEQAGSFSLAVLLGSENALKISAGIFLLVAVVSILPFVLGWIEWLYVFPLLVMDVLILYSATKLLDSEIADRRKYIRLIYLSGLAAILVFIAMNLVRS
ncbi:MAG TPA: UbiA family prenyltransferase [Anaerolineales bacterium]|nr:UbiA family prenyltransferase [Anaerolineales bacterium]